MTPRKEIYLAIKDELVTIPEIGYVDLHRNQFAPGKESYPPHAVACLVKVVAIQWDAMSEQMQEGSALVEATLYLFETHPNPEVVGVDSLVAMDLIDAITAKLRFLKGELFKPLEQMLDESLETEVDGLLAYKLSFISTIYKRTAPKYQEVANPVTTISFV